MNKITYVKLATSVLLAAFLAGCGGSALPDNERLEQVFTEGQTGVWISGHGSVSQVPADESGATPVQRLVVRVSEDLSLMVRHELEHSERIPAAKGDTVAFQGRYEWDGRGGTVSFTYADGDQPGGGGWVELDGKRYE